MKTNPKFRDLIQVRSQFIFSNLPIIYLITYMDQFSYAANTIIEELKNCKILPKYPGVTPGQTSPFLPSKIGPKTPMFYLNAYVAEFLYAGTNTKQELRNAKYI